MDSTDFTTALTRAQQAGIGKDEFLKIWDMEAQLRLVREQAKRCGQQESKLQKSTGFTERNINNATEGNHSTFENSTQETRMSPDLLKGREQSEDLTKNLPCLGKDAAVNVNTDVSLQTYKLKEDFDQVRKELAEEMRQLKEEVKSLKDNSLFERCQENDHDKLCSEISKQKQELAGLKEDVRQWRKDFVELKEILLTMNGKLDEAAQAKETRASAMAVVYKETSSSEDISDIASDSAVTIGTQTCMFDEDREEKRNSSMGKPEHRGYEHNAEEEIHTPSLGNLKTSEHKVPAHLQTDQDLPQTQASQNHQQHQSQQADPLQQQQSQQETRQEPQQNKETVASVGNQLPGQHQAKSVSRTDSVSNKQPAVSDDIPYLTKDGAVFEVKDLDLDKALAGKQPIIFSPIYRLPKSSKTVCLCFQFHADTTMNIHLLITGLDEQSATEKEVLHVSGLIKHPSTQEYTRFFCGTKRLWRCNGPEVKVHASVCLITPNKIPIRNVSLKGLKKRQYIDLLSKSIFIKWLVTRNKG